MPAAGSWLRLELQTWTLSRSPHKRIFGRVGEVSSADLSCMLHAAQPFKQLDSAQRTTTTLSSEALLHRSSVPVIESSLLCPRIE